MADDAAADADNSAAPPPLDEPNDSQESDHPVAALPPEFFMPLEQFDSVHHTLANLPDDGLDAGYLAAQTAQTQVVLDAINSQLSARVMRSYGAFVHGMAQVQQLESDMVHTAILCRSSRRHLGRVQSGAVVGGLRSSGASAGAASCSSSPQRSARSRRCRRASAHSSVS